MRHPEVAFKWIVKIFRKNGIPFQITGGYAAKIYGSIRTLFDIDIDVPDKYIEKVAAITKKYIIYGPTRYKDDAFDCLLMTLDYHGQRIDLSGSTSEKTFNKKTKKWRSSGITLYNSEKRKVAGIEAPVENKADLISYKKLIARKTDLLDIKYITRKRIIDSPVVRQAFNYDCGAEAIRAILAYYGKDIREDEVMKLTGTNQEIGTQLSGMLKVFKKFGLKTKAGSMTIEQIKANIDEGTPTILMLQAWSKKKKINWSKTWDEGHYVIAVGYDESKIYFRDPSSVYITYLPEAELKERWHDKDHKGKKYINFGIVVEGKKPNYTSSKVTKMK